MSPGGAGRRTTRWATAALIVAASGAARAASLSVEEGPVVLGRTASADVVIQLDERPGAEDVPLRLSVNVGRFSDPVRVGPGRYRAAYVPPATRFPQVALVAAWRESGPDAGLDFLRIPLLGITRVPVTARPGARVRVRVGAETFGPVTAGRSGRAEVAVRVPPGVTRCEVRVTERRGRETAREVPVEVPPYNRLTAALVPHAGPAGVEARLEVFYDVGGAEVPPDAIRVVASAGTASLVHASRGLYTFRVVPPAGAGGPVTYAVSVAGDLTARAGAELALTTPPPERLVVTPPARPLRAGSGESVAVDVLVLDASGAGVPGVEISATANGEPLPPPSSLGEGRYALRVTAPPAVPPGGALVIEAVAHHAESFAFGTTRCEVEATPAAPLPLPPPPPLAPAPAPPPVQAPAMAAARRDRGAASGSIACPVADERPRGVSDGSAAFDRSFTASRRERGRVLAGFSAGYTRSPGVASGLRAGPEVWAPIQIGEARLGAGLSAGLGSATRTVSDATGALRSTTEATFVPVALKLGVQAWASRRVAVTAGAGPLLAWARFRSSLATGAQQGLGLGWTGFVDLDWQAGPGAFVVGLSYGSAVVTTADYRVDPAGLSLAAGYRLKVL